MLRGLPEVMEAAIVPVKDEVRGEEVKAYIQLKPGVTMTPEAIVDYCKSKLAPYKVPRYIRFVTQFPMTVTGKIQKFKIRDEMKQQLGLQEDKTA